MMRVKWWKFTRTDSTTASNAASPCNWLRIRRNSAMCWASMLACEAMKDTPWSPSRNSDSRMADAKGPPYTEAMTSSAYSMPSTDAGWRRSAAQ